MIRVLSAAALIMLIAGCHLTESAKSDILPPLYKWQQAAEDRHLDGESADALKHLAQEKYRAALRQKLPDLAVFVREKRSEEAYELSVDILWECVEASNILFVDDPAVFIRRMRRGTIRCRAASLIAEKQFLDTVVWKSAAQQERSLEVDSELSQLCGGIPYGELAQIILATPEEMKKFSAETALPVSEDPAEILQIAGVFCLIPPEIQRQKLADPYFRSGGIGFEVMYMAATYALYIDCHQLRSAQLAYEKNPTAENLWRWRKWFYRAELDKSRIPVYRGSDKDKQFLNSMLLLQESF
jgi:hypothetical protein